MTSILSEINDVFKKTFVFPKYNMLPKDQISHQYIFNIFVNESQHALCIFIYLNNSGFVKHMFVIGK